MSWRELRSQKKAVRKFYRVIDRRMNTAAKIGNSYAKASSFVSGVEHAQKMALEDPRFADNCRADWSWWIDIALTLDSLPPEQAKRCYEDELGADAEVRIATWFLGDKGVVKGIRPHEFSFSWE